MIDIHVIKKNDKYIVFNPESLSLFKITENIGEMLESYESRSESRTESVSCIEIDIARLLISFDEKINCDIDKSWVKKDPTALCLIVSHDCNLRCGYCYADHGTFWGERKLMGFKTAKHSMRISIN